MEYDEDKVDEVVLALLYLTMFEDHGITRAWKGYDWAVLNRLYEKDWISDPKGKAKSLCLTDEGKRLAGEFFLKYFGRGMA
ncbi:MAG: hypothetical protein JXQ27_14290 [Acidobacteria bacterium]|nr:hypothetical protein [Acidobacteriota bacterium]